MSVSMPTAASLDDLVALNDEIAALARAGVPLSGGLAALGGDMPGRLGALSSVIAKRLEAGQSLPDALAGEATRLPSVYRAVVEAGLRAGRLPAALEGLARLLRQARDLRRAVLAGLIYPALVVTVAWVFFVLFVVWIAPRWSESFKAFGVNDYGLLAALARAGPSATWWGTLAPAAVLVILAIWWYCSGRASLVAPRGPVAVLGFVPWFGPMLRAARRAVLVDVLAMLVEQDVPLEEGLSLAAESTGDRRLAHSVGQLARRMRLGEPPDAAAMRAAGLPALVSWAIAAGRRRGQLAASLRQAGRTYHRRAEHAAWFVRSFVPVLLGVAAGGLVVLLYALILFVPYTTMLRVLGGP